jgi:hypothetical protein
MAVLSVFIEAEAEAEQNSVITERLVPLIQHLIHLMMANYAETCSVA